jgi:hypothetical protein
LGTGAIANRQREFRPFEESREFVRSLKMKCQTDWRTFASSGNLPDDIPTNPNRSYKDKGWSGYGDWLGTGTIAPRLRKCRPFKEARQFARGLGLKNKTEWFEFVKLGGLPDDIPTNPNKRHKGEGWTGYADWLASET